MFPSETPDIVDAANLDTAIAAEALISSLTIVPFNIFPVVIIPTLPVVRRVPVSEGKVNIPDAVAEARRLTVPEELPLKLAPPLPTVGVVRVLFVNV